ncbi:MAG: hypothetical protein A3J97_10470 [Spirochaetes bacterium RIFOXYC1_FULL_54_7]|nr:MAG: hypothetical protein A3J97_10470 [Spirochaetes bacterium RIFOXYC1_FULL_54_7]
MRTKYFFSAVMVLAVLAGAILVSGGHLMIVLDPYSMILVLGLPFIIAFGSWPLRDICRAFSAPFDPSADGKDLRKAAEFFESFRSWLAVSAATGAMTGLLLMLALFDLDNGLARLGSNLAVMLLSVFYALVLNLLFVLPLGALARRRLLDMQATRN